MEDLHRNVLRIIDDALEKDPGRSRREAQELGVLSGEGDRPKGLKGPVEIHMEFLRQKMIEGPGQAAS